jgi:hypothetical protein
MADIGGQVAGLGCNATARHGQGLRASNLLNKQWPGVALATIGVSDLNVKPKAYC